MKKFAPVMILLFLGSLSMSAPPQQLENNVYDGYLDSLVSIREAGSGRVMGSGFVYRSEGYIITNNHVIASEENLRVRFNGTGEWRKAEIIGGDSETDLAVLKTGSLPPGTESLEISDEKPVEGQRVGILGNPLGREAVILPGRIVETEDIITKEGLELDDTVKIAAAVKLGSSGGPVLTPEGKVVGVISAKSIDKEFGFAVPSENIGEVVPELINNKTES